MWLSDEAPRTTTLQMAEHDLDSVEDIDALATGQSAQMERCKEATAAVFDITELVECILQYLDSLTVLRAQSVSKQWQDIIKCMIRTNILVREKLFLSPADVDEILSGNLEAGQRYKDYYMRYPEPINPPLVSKYPSFSQPTMLNPWLITVCNGAAFKNGYEIVLCGSELANLVAKKNLRSQMLLTQPLTKRITWQVRLGQKHEGCERPLTEHTSGQDLYIATRGSERSDGSIQGLAAMLKFVERKVLQHWGCAVDWQGSHVHLGGKLASRQELQDQHFGVVELSEEMWRVLETREYTPLLPSARFSKVID